MKKKTYKLLEKPPNNKRKKLIGDIWLAKVPYHERGNYYKRRPVLIVDYIDEKYLCKKITSTYKPSRKKIEINGKTSYVSHYITLDEYMFYHLIRRGVDVKNYI